MTVSWLPPKRGSEEPQQARKEIQAISEYLPDEHEYTNLAEFLRSGGMLEIGERPEFGSFARLQIERTKLHVVTMK